MRPALVAWLLVLAVAVAVVPARAAAQRAPKGAIVAAVAHAIYHYPTPEKVRLSVSLASRVDRRWSLVTGNYGRRGLWAAWVRRTPAGRYGVVVFRTRDFDPGTAPPCDIRPAFSEPSC